MSDKLFSRLYWRPYILIGICMLLVLLSSLLPYLLPWIFVHYTGYDVYFFKFIAYLVKAAMLLYIVSVYRALTAKYFPRLDKLCTKEVRAVITEHRTSWMRGKQLCPVFTYTVGEKEYSEPLNEARGSREKTGDVIDKGFTLKLPRKIRYNPDNPREFYIAGQEYYSRKAAIVRYVLFSILFFIQLYVDIFQYAR